LATIVINALRQKPTRFVRDHLALSDYRLQIVQVVMEPLQMAGTGFH